MKAVFKQPPTHRAVVFMRAAGYAQYVNRDGDESFVRRTGGGEFPRFHAYVHEDATPISISIHIDQKGTTYEGSRAHSGEYQGPLISGELARISAALSLSMAIVADKNGKPVDR